MSLGHFFVWLVREAVVHCCIMLKMLSSSGIRNCVLTVPVWQSYQKTTGTHINGSFNNPLISIFHILPLIAFNYILHKNKMTFSSGPINVRIEISGFIISKHLKYREFLHGQSRCGMSETELIIYIMYCT